MHFAKSLCPLSTVFLLQSCHRAPRPPQSAPAPLRPPNIVRRHHSRVLQAPPERKRSRVDVQNLAFLYTKEEKDERTKSRPVRGKFAKFTQYRFTLLEEDKVKTLPSGATVKGTTQYYHYKSCGKPGLLLRRKFPCFCSACLNDDSQNCPNASWSGKWEEVAVKAK